MNRLGNLFVCISHFELLFTLLRFVQLPPFDHLHLGVLVPRAKFGFAVDRAILYQKERNDVGAIDNEPAREEQVVEGII